MPTPTPVPMGTFTQNLGEGANWFISQFGSVITLMQSNTVLLFCVGLLSVSIIVGLVLKVKHGI